MSVEDALINCYRCTVCGCYWLGRDTCDVYIPSVIGGHCGGTYAEVRLAMHQADIKSGRYKAYRWSVWDASQKPGPCCDNSPDFLTNIVPADAPNNMADLVLDQRPRHPDVHGVRWVKGRPYARLRVVGKSISVPLSAVGTNAAHLAERRQVIFDQVRRLLAAGRADMTEALAGAIGRAESALELKAAIGAVDVTCQEAARLDPDVATVRDIGDRWVTGELARRYPDHIRSKRSASRDKQLLETYVYPVIGDMPVTAVKLDDVERVMRRIPALNQHSKKPKPLSIAQRRHIAQVMHRLFKMAAYPMRLIEHSPLPTGFLPKLGGGKAKVYLYPDEDARLMACTSVPLMYRLFYGMLAREGLRFGEGRKLTWEDLDLDRGALRLDKNKTDEARAWAMDPGVVRALARWKERVHKQLDPEEADGLLAKSVRRTLNKLQLEKFPGPFPGILDDGKQAERFRDDLRKAGVDRDDLHVASDERTRVRVHDLRATFVTLSLANGKSETWVSDRTGHKSSAMIARYKRAARTAAELKLGDLKPLDEAIVWEETWD